MFKMISFSGILFIEIKKLQEVDCTFKANDSTIFNSDAIIYISMFKFYNSYF